MRIFFVFSVIFICSLFTFDLARAGDYYHACSTPGGGYSYDHDTQILTTENNGNSRNIQFNRISKVLLQERKGYCVSQKCNAKFNFNSEEYVTTLKIIEQGTPLELKFICEVAASGLPASCDCDREVVTRHRILRPVYRNVAKAPGVNSQTSPQPFKISSYWSHNGSSVSLSAQGSTRIFRYHNPRPAIKRACAEHNDIIFEGTKTGKNYTGTATIFSCKCGKYSYPVSGEVAKGGSRVILSGAKPVRDGNCSITNSKSQTLIFNYVRKP